MSVIGIDTSNYTTSIAFFDGIGGENCSKLLPVKQGELGLRQSDAVFAHIKSLPELSGRLFSHVEKGSITAVGVSTRPRAVEGSYMPCFMVGYSHAKILSDALGVPMVEVSHQQGHVAASLWSAGHIELMDQPHLAWHLSGGTTELLLVEPEGKNVKCTKHHPPGKFRDYRQIRDVRWSLAPHQSIVPTHRARHCVQSRVNCPSRLKCGNYPSIRRDYKRGSYLLHLRIRATHRGILSKTTSREICISS